MGPGQDQNNMEAGDVRNMFVFFVLAVCFFLLFDTFFFEPARQAAEKVNMEEQAAGQLEVARESFEERTMLERDDAIGKSARLSFSNAQMRGSIALEGARLDDVLLNDYYQTIDKQDNVVLMSPNRTKESRFVDFGWIAKTKGVQVPGAETLWRVAEDTQELTPETPVTLYWENAQGVRFERKISIDDSFLMTVEQRVINNSAQSISMHPYGLISQNGLRASELQSWLQHEGPIGVIGDKLEEIAYATIQEGGKESFSADQGWIGITEKYWLTAILPQQGIEQQFAFDHDGPRIRGMSDKGRYQVDVVGALQDIPPGGDVSITSNVFTGAKRVLLLEEYQSALGVPKLDLAVNFGWFWFFSKPFFYALHFLGELLGNMGLAIICLTVIIRSATFPLTNLSYKSFAKMKQVTPQITVLREQYGDDKAKLQEKIMELYQKNGVNPLAGCFPVVMQIPIFFALYKVLFVTIEIRHAPFYGWINDLSSRDPTSIFNLFGLIDWTPPEIMMIGVWPCLMLLTLLVQKRLNPPPQDKMQRTMMMYFPFFITFIMSKFAAGLVIYWTVSGLLGIAQQIIIMRSLGVPIHLFGQSEEEEKLDRLMDETADVHPVAEMIEHDVEEALIGTDNDKPVKPKKKAPGKSKKSKKSSGGKKK